MSSETDSGDSVLVHMKKRIEDLQILLDEANEFLQECVENQPAIDPRE